MVSHFQKYYLGNVQVKLTFKLLTFNFWLVMHADKLIPKEPIKILVHPVTWLGEHTSIFDYSIRVYQSAFCGHDLFYLELDGHMPIQPRPWHPTGCILANMMNTPNFMNNFVFAKYNHVLVLHDL